MLCVASDAGIAQVVERRTENPRVPSASLGPGAFLLVPGTV